MSPLFYNDPKNKKGFSSNKISEKIRADLPIKFELDQLTPKEAKILNYRMVKDLKKTFGYLNTNESMFNFSTSNISSVYLCNLIGLRLEGFILRVRIIVYTTLIVSLTSFPLVCAITIFILEVLHVLSYLYYTIRYKYAKNWLFLISKINIGISILAITTVAIE